MISKIWNFEETYSRFWIWSIQRNYKALCNLRKGCAWGKGNFAFPQVFMILTVPPTIPPKNISVKWKYFRGMTEWSLGIELYREIFDGTFPGGSCTDLFFRAGLTMWGMQTWLLLKFALEAAEEYLLIESQIACNTTVSIVILTFESYL